MSFKEIPIGEEHWVHVTRRNNLARSGLQLWFYIYFRTLTPLLREGIFLDEWPAVMVFRRDNLARRQQDNAKHSLTTARQQIEWRTIVGTKWNPWVGSQIDEHPDIRHARLLSMQRVVFYDPEHETNILYLGERFLKQMLGQIVIPM
ncbi:hypothetical protein MKX01_042182, partial [Papaver californicum]